LVTEYALPREIPKIYSNVGFDIRATNLYPEQNEFTALIDFVRKGYEKERHIQIRALQETNTPYIELKGRYTTDDIRAIYRKSSMYFVAFRESFGLPIIELQLCGSIIFTPYKEWLPAHFLNKSIYEAGNGTLGSNFFIYNNDLEKLKDYIINLKKNYSPNAVIENFKKEYPSYYSGDKVELRDFVSKLKNQDITGLSHSDYEIYNKYINLKDDVYLYE